MPGYELYIFNKILWGTLGKFDIILISYQDYICLILSDLILLFFLLVYIWFYAKLNMILSKIITIYIYKCDIVFCLMWD